MRVDFASEVEGEVLVLVKTVVERHAGRVEVVGRLGQGSTFCVWLPASTG